MILRRITEHVKAQNWAAVGLDFAVGWFAVTPAVRSFQNIDYVVGRIATIDPHPIAEVKNQQWSETCQKNGR